MRGAHRVMGSDRRTPSRCTLRPPVSWRTASAQPCGLRGTPFPGEARLS